MPHVSIKPEGLFEIFGITVTNSALTSVLASLLLIGIILYYFGQLNKKRSERGLFFYGLNAILNQLYTLFGSVTGESIKALFPLLACFFLFILMQNWFGLLPGVGSITIKPQVHEVQQPSVTGTEHLDKETAKESEHEEKVPLFRGGTADLNMTLALGIIAVIAIQFFGFTHLGVKQYLGKFFNFSSPIYFFIGILELISEFSRAFSFSFRLFGNIIAGEILLVIIATLVPVLASFPFVVMETFVGLIQAVVFATLAAIFIKMAITSHSH
jgi:F-type H+-transporting ATPase subunit a